MLYKLEPSIENGRFTDKIVKTQVLKRFIPNENYKIAKLKFITRVENSHKSSLGLFIDYFHRSSSDIYIYNNIKKKKYGRYRRKYYNN